jgi:hypothetical protein
MIANLSPIYRLVNMLSLSSSKILRFYTCVTMGSAAQWLTGKWPVYLFRKDHRVGRLQRLIEVGDGVISLASRPS